jgi:hypothetical protein
LLGPRTDVCFVWTPRLRPGMWWMYGNWPVFCSGLCIAVKRFARSRSPENTLWPGAGLGLRGISTLTFVVVVAGWKGLGPAFNNPSGLGDRVRTRPNSRSLGLGGRGFHGSGWNGSGPGPISDDRSAVTYTPLSNCCGDDLPSGWDEEYCTTALDGTSGPGSSAI